MLPHYSKDSTWHTTTASYQIAREHHVRVFPGASEPGGSLTETRCLSFAVVSDILQHFLAEVALAAATGEASTVSCLFMFNLSCSQINLNKRKVWQQHQDPHIHAEKVY